DFYVNPAKSAHLSANSPLIDILAGNHKIRRHTLFYLISSAVKSANFFIGHDLQANRVGKVLRLLHKYFSHNKCRHLHICRATTIQIAICYIWPELFRRARYDVYMAIKDDFELFWARFAIIGEKTWFIIAAEMLNSDTLIFF